MAAILDDIKIRVMPGRASQIRAYVSGKIKLAEGGYVYLNGMRLVHSPKASSGLFLSFPAWAPGRGGDKSEWKETYFLSKADTKKIEEQAIHAYNRRLAAS
jgi:hypothetical protein